MFDECKVWRSESFLPSFTSRVILFQTKALTPTPKFLWTPPTFRFPSLSPSAVGGSHADCASVLSSEVEKVIEPLQSLVFSPLK